TIYITEIPYAVNKSTLVEAIAQVVIQRKLPPLVDIKDVSTEDVRIALELKKDADEQKVLAYLFKHTPLQTNFNVNLTCLIPTENPEVGRPERCDLREILQCFLNFRLEVVTKRLEHELKQLLRRIHILEGFELVFDVLDEIIKIIRASEGKADAARKIIKHFEQLDEDQTEAILELKLYRLAKLEINLIRDELTEKRKRVGEIQKLLKETDADGRWAIVKEELLEIRNKYGKKDKRRTTFADEQAQVEYDEEDFILDEDARFMVTRDGWIKRQKNPIDPDKIRLREGDSVLAASIGSTRATVAFFSNFGVVYTARIIDLPATTGYGEPIQKLFKLKDGEVILSAISLDKRIIGNITAEGDNIPKNHGIATSTDGYSIRFSLAPFAEPSTRAGRKFARPAKGQQIVAMYTITGEETLIVASQRARALLCQADEINFVSGPAKGVQLIKLGKDDYVIGFVTSMGDRQTMTVKTSMGGEQRINTGKYETTSRGGKGREILKRGTFTRMTPPDLEIIELA
ncbi:MAG: DNA topoisomerase, partial [Phycisphaeraceae bacterium]|nr:DNA topoisomerase [Phycisphaeraceae bacterium]